MEGGMMRVFAVWRRGRPPVDVARAVGKYLSISENAYAVHNDEHAITWSMPINRVDLIREVDAAEQAVLWGDDMVVR
jgi:hypothetical protein